jgi:23S rRNA (adenine-N6)-dimethyltransferase
VAGRRRSAADRRRRTHGQNLLADATVVDRLLARLELAEGDLVVEFGPGRGALTVALARAGARVLAVERDRRFVADLQARLEREGLADRVQLRRGDLREVPLPRRTYRVVANPPFGLTSVLLGRLLDDPDRGPTRADLLLQREVARKHASQPPVAVRTAAWAPWWRFELGERVARDAFRPVPAVDAQWLTVHRRDPPVLPTSMASGFADALRPLWRA